MHRLKALAWFVVLTGCVESTDPFLASDANGTVDTGGAVDTGGTPDAGTPPSVDAGSPAVDSAMPDVSPPPADAGGGVDAGGPSPNIDPRPISEAEAECAGLTAPECASCHVYEGRWYLSPYWAPPPPPDMAPSPAPAPGCVTPPRSNSLSAEAIECFGLAEPACAACHTAGDGNIYLRPWGNVPPPPPTVSPVDPSCYDLL